MAFIFKFIGSVTALVATSLLAAESARRGVFIFVTILGIIKLLVVCAFVFLLLVILYLLLTPRFPKDAVQKDES